VAVFDHRRPPNTCQTPDFCSDLEWEGQDSEIGCHDAVLLLQYLTVGSNSGSVILVVEVVVFGWKKGCRKASNL
jgi:hypothetical protein